MTHYFTSTPVVKYVHQKMSTRNRPWKTWKQYAKLNVISKILNVIKAKRVWAYFRRRKRENISSNERRVLQTGESREGKSRANVLRLKENFYSRMVWQWWKNGWTSFPSRSQGPFHYQNFKCPKIFSNFLQKYFWIFINFFLFLNLGEIRKRKFLSAS